MDPDEALAQIRVAVAGMNREDSPGVDFVEHARDLADLVEALDEWLTQGGFPPASWRS
jgi:hypothetical protein